jgi:hypothetical protein
MEGMAESDTISISQPSLSDRGRAARAAARVRGRTDSLVAQLPSTWRVAAALRLSNKRVIFRFINRINPAFYTS